MEIYWILRDDPDKAQQLQELADFQRLNYGQKLDIPSNKFKPVNFDPFKFFDTEEAGKLMRQKPRKLRRVK